MKIKNLISIVSIISLITLGSCNSKKDLPLYTEEPKILGKHYTVEVRALDENGTRLWIYENGVDRTKSKWNGVSFALDKDGNNKIDRLQGPIPYFKEEVYNQLNKVLENFQEIKFK